MARSATSILRVNLYSRSPSADGTVGLAVLARGLGGAWAEEGKQAGTALDFDCSNGNDARIPCDQLSAYIDQCGVRCPVDSAILGNGAPACHMFTFGKLRNDGQVFFDTDPLTGQTCASKHVTVEWFPLINSYTRMNLHPENVCCPGPCQTEINNWREGMRLW